MITWIDLIIFSICFNEYKINILYNSIITNNPDLWSVKRDKTKAD